MANCGFVWPITSDTATLSGGTWDAGLPLTNAQLPAVATVARTVTDANADSIVNVDFGAASEVGVVALSRHNLQKDALIRVRMSAASDMSGATYDSGWVAAWPVQWAADVLPSGHPNAATRLLTNAQIAALDPARDIVHVLTTPTTARYLRCEIDDDTNTDTVVEIGRFIAGPLYRPSNNLNVGAAFGIDDASVIGRALSGTRYYDQRPKGRTLQASFGPLTQDEAVGVLQEMQRQLGTSGQLYFVLNPEDAPNLQRTSFLATFRELSAVDLASAGFASFPLALEEVL
jgi:hypothetical protein